MDIPKESDLAKKFQLTIFAGGYLVKTIGEEAGWFIIVAFMLLYVWIDGGINAIV